MRSRGGPTPCPTCTRPSTYPAGYDGGWAFTAPVVEMPVYLDWLAARVLAAGGSITRLNLHGLPTPR